MTKKEKSAVLAFIAYLNDKELRQWTIDMMNKSLGSIIDKMYQLGYSKEDIIEQRKYEKWKCDIADIYYYASQRRGIKLYNTDVVQED